MADHSCFVRQGGTIRRARPPLSMDSKVRGEGVISRLMYSSEEEET